LASFLQFLKDGHYVNEGQIKTIQSEYMNVRNSTYYGAIKRANAMPEEQLLLLACNFFNVSLIENSFRVEVDFAATEKVLGDVFAAIESRMCVVHYNGKMTFIVNDPENENLRSKASTALGEQPEFAIASEKEFNIILQYKLNPYAINKQSDTIKTAPTTMVLQQDTRENASHVQRFLDMLIRAALERNASDLHLQQITPDTAQILLRIDGRIYYYASIRSDILPNLRNKLKTMSQVGGETVDKPVEGQISYDYCGQTIDIRINILSTENGFDFCLRFINSHITDLEELGLADTNYQKFLDLLHMTKGLVIICGPTGCGKTTLLYAGFKKLLSEEKLPIICTIEDPVEIKMPGITQISLDKEKKMSYADIFPSLLRADPDIIAIGETRTVTVAEQAIQSSNTGHLTFTTLHTNDAVGAISRLVNMGVDAYSVGDVLAAVVAQRLIRRVCPSCAEEYELPQDHIWRTRYNLGNGRVKLKRGCGCAACAGTGYKGRMAVNEFMITTPDLRSAIQKNATRTEIEDILESHGYQTYIKDAIQKALDGVTTFDEVDVLYRDIL
jgi:type IV pilus assembly protein PilB